jgi:hypothetical protein
MRSRLFIPILSIVLALLTLVPYLIAYASAGSLRFTGFLFNFADAASYLAKMRQGYEGQWLYHLAFTDNPGPGVLFFPWYLLLGHLARIFSLPLIAVWQIARIAGATVFLIVVWEFFGRIGLAPRSRAIAWVFTALGSGFGFVAIILLHGFTSDLWVAEYIPFLGMLTSAHFPLAIGLILLIVMRVARPVGRQTIFSLPTTAAIGAALGAIQPFGILPAGLALAVWIVWRRVASGRFPEGSVAGLVAAALGMLPWVVYDFWVTQTLPNFASWFSQNQTATQPLWDIALSMGLPGLIVAISFGQWLRTPENIRSKIRSIPLGTLLLGIWLVINLFLLYAPFSLQRRLMMGMWIPMVALAAPKIEAWLFSPAFSIPRGWIIGIPLVLTNAAFFGFLLVAGIRHNPNLFLTRDEAAAIDWLNANAQGSVVLASPEISVWLPGLAGVRVVYGHPMETPDAQAAKAAVEDYFSGTGSARLPVERGADYVVIGPRELTFNGKLDLVAFGKPITFGTVDIYSVP